MTCSDHMLRHEQAIDLAIGSCTCRYALVTIANARLSMERVIQEAKQDAATDSLKGVFLMVWNWLKGKKRGMA